jgi:predicted metal-dependent hydrolase
VLEPAWKKTRSDFYHGLILLASAFVHRERRNRHGVLAQLDKALPLLERYTPAHEGVDVDALLTRAAELRTWAQEP